MQITTIELILLIGLLISIGISVFIFIRVSKVINNYRQLTKDVRGRNLEDLLQEHLARVENNNKSISQILQKIKIIEETSRTHFQKIGFKRFNPFHETGGDQSFILVLLDDNNSGVIISSLHQREVTRVYAKSIDKGDCSHKLSKEEAEVLKETSDK